MVSREQGDEQSCDGQNQALAARSYFKQPLEENLFYPGYSRTAF